ncbi:MAG: hypothetical protein JRM74_04875 [Nitrososphaerota archaeon]|nr:hypothetical protein [Nitrososphaerota archaeon]
MNRAVYPVAVAVAIRVALAPFFMHAWDMTTLMTASQQFLSGVNPYTYVQQQAALQQAATGLPLPFYGFAYTATTLLVYAPFYWAYHALGFAPLPLTGWQLQPGQALGLVYPAAFYFLLLMKIPVIAADAAVVYLLYKRAPRLGWVYALSPYVIVITSLWGNFDPLIGLFLLIAYLAFDRSKLLSGFVFGLSMMKVYTVVATPAFLLAIGKKPRDLASFLVGAAVAQIPSAYYLAADPSSFLYALGFQASRPANGVNIYYALIELRSIYLEISAANLVSAVFVASLAVATYAMWRSKTGLKESIVLLMLVYIVFAPVTNEQLLAAVIPIGLLCRNFSHKLTVFPLVYIMFNATYFYFATPLFFQTPALIAVYNSLNGWWGGIVGSYIIQARYLVGAAMGVSALVLARSTFEGPLRLRVTLPKLALPRRGAD